MANKQAKIYHFDLYGKRQEKYDFLNENSINSIEWTELDVQEPNFYFIYKDTAGQDEYEKGFVIGDLFNVNTTGIKTHDDKNLVSMMPFEENNHRYDYRPFDSRYINYDLEKVVRHRYSVMKHMLKENISLLIPRQAVTDNWNHLLVSKNLSDNRIQYSNKGIPIVCPLYLYPDSDSTLLEGKNADRVPNLNMEIVEKIAKGLQLEFEAEKSGETNKFAPIDLLDYIYAVLHSPSYREKYKEFLKIDFPRIPYPKDKNTFWALVELGGEVRQIHLMESAVVEEYITTYLKGGNNKVTRKLTLRSPGFVLTEDGLGQVWINDEQYFDNVPQIAWEFYIGGYQPAQKWLKDRVGRTLDIEDILHYQKIIVAQTETDKLMKEIDKIEFM